ncbi:hypothetical protein BN134_2838 [Cronobacter dublinensis 1210]|uniref:Uncharacterized protein n=1 Tax=Cronobacter dublinensis 1210 TaxID=1208656 RepID=A0ABP1W958_9ENTR|nr:hypothetical protein BN134_2838 [Cronobacter dublinensis 1210]
MNGIKKHLTAVLAWHRKGVAKNGESFKQIEKFKFSDKFCFS